MEAKTAKSGKWYMTILGGLIGLILGLILPCLSIIFFHQLYFVCLMFTPILACLFIKLLRGNKNIYAMLYVILMSLICTLISGFILEADVLIQVYALPKHEIIRLTFLMIAEFGTYFADVWQTIAGDIFNVIIIIAYIAIGVIISWEFIFKSIKKKAEVIESSEVSDEAPASEDEFEYVYEDELEPDDEIIESDKQ